jgi:hypothetical protein
VRYAPQTANSRKFITANLDFVFIFSVSLIIPCKGNKNVGNNKKHEENIVFLRGVKGLKGEEKGLKGEKGGEKGRKGTIASPPTVGADPRVCP